MTILETFVLDGALDTAKDEISQSFVNGFKVTLEKFRAVYPDLDQSNFDPFKVVVDNKIVDE